jgi:hypothetical protein
MGMAQIVSPWETESEAFKLRIKNIEFFIKRFNNENDSAATAVVLPSDTVTYQRFLKKRELSLVSLFDQVRIRNQSERAFRDRATRFIHFVNDPSRQQYLHFTDSTWWAEATVAATYQGKPVQLRCVLRIITIPSGGFEWTLLSISLEQEKLQDRFEASTIIFPPSAHGTDFISLSLKLNDHEFLKKMGENHESHSILHLLFEKRLLAGAVTFIRYHFIQVDGWVVTSDYVNRASKNSGWLVGDVTEMDANSKTAYRKVFLGY